MARIKNSIDTPVIRFPVPRDEGHRPQYDERFTQILTTAAQVIAEQGYEKASIRAIASRARMSIA